MQKSHRMRGEYRFNGLRMRPFPNSRPTALVALILFCSASLAGDSMPESQTCELRLVRSHLYSVASDLDVWRVYRQSDFEDINVERALAVSVVEDVTVIGAIDFSVDELTGRPLETLCRLSEKDALRLFSVHPNPALARIARTYVESIEQEVREHVAEVQATLLGDGCNLSPR